MNDKEQRRKKTFEAKVQKDHDGLWLTITHNGSQWHGISLNHDEMAIVIKVLKKELGNEWQRLWRE